MRIALTVFGVYHHFELARELRSRRHDTRIYSTFPMRRLRRENFPAELIETFPLFHMAEILAQRAVPNWPSVADQFGAWNAQAFDAWTRRRIEACDVLIGLSGSALRTGQDVQKRGGVFLCDRGSTHQRYQAEVVRDEFRRWGATHRVSDPRDTEREEAIYEAADAITVPSTAAKRSFVAMGVEASKVSVIPYGVNLAKFFPEGEPAEGHFDVLFAGLIGLRKGIPYLLEAFAKLRHPRKRLRVIGLREPEIGAILERLPQENVEIMHAVSQTELRGWMSRAHLLVLPSVEEGLALVQAEAMACGCPVLCSEATGGEDLFADGVEGFIVPVRDVDAMAERMQRLADSPELQRAMRVAALERAQLLSGWSGYGDLWVELLARLTGLPSRGN